MTEEFKEQLLNYITDNITPETSENKPIFNDTEELTNDLFSFVEEGLDNNDFRFSGYLQSTNTSNYIIYGNYWTTAHQQIPKSFLVIVDTNLNPVKLLTSYDSGTEFRKFDKLALDEDDNIYGVDYVFEYNGQGQVINKQRRFIMLNNILTSNLLYGDYKAILRKSYIMSYKDFDTFQLHKNYDSADYVLVGANQVSNNYRISIITLKVNVGEENEWAIYNSSYTNYQDIESFIVWSGEDISLKIVTTNFSGSTPKYLELLFNGSTYTQNLTFNLPIIEQEYPEQSYLSHITIKDLDDVYYQIGMYPVILKTNYDTNSYDTIYNNYETPNITNINLYSINNNVVFGMYVRDIEEQQSLLTYGMIIDKDIYFSETIEIDFYIDINLFIVKNNFNLYQLIYQAEDKLYISNTDYNFANYNGLPYNDYNGLLPEKSRLYNNDRLIFARNLYNKTSLNNTTVSTVQIPNGMLNDIDISSKCLLGETGITLVQDNNVVQKNTYETVFLNFINTIDVIDEDTNTKYPVASTYVNNNINIGTQTNSQNTSVNKVRINYTDNTTKVFNINWEVLDSTHRKIEFAIYVDKDMTSIDYISNNESIIYCTKELEVEVGNYYKITQYLRME
jgi:hypothetical protein